MCEDQGLFSFRLRPKFDLESTDCNVTFYNKCERYIEDDVSEGTNTSCKYRKHSKIVVYSRCPHEYIVEHILLHFIALCYPAPWHVLSQCIDVSVIDTYNSGCYHNTAGVLLCG